MSMKLYVGNLAFETTSSDLQTLFAQAGTVESVSLIEDRETGRSRGFGFVEMQTKEEGAAAVEKFNGTELAGRALKVNEAKPRENRGNGGGSTDGAASALGLFLPNAPAFPLLHRGRVTEVLVATPPANGEGWSGPVAALVDGATASASLAAQSVRS